MRLDRFLAQHTHHGRRGIRPMLAAGRITVDGLIEKNTRCAIGKFTQVCLDGEILRHTQAIYLMMHKPAGYLSATIDEQHPTVMELIDKNAISEELHIAGRLDRATTGLLILTNDGKWSRLLTEPKERVPKVYQVETADPITAETQSLFEQGIYFAYEDLTTQPAKLEILHPCHCRLTIYEGRYHQVKRMFHAVGNRVTALHRISIGAISLDDYLKPGEYRKLTHCEIQGLV